MNLDLANLFVKGGPKRILLDQGCDNKHSIFRVLATMKQYLENNVEMSTDIDLQEAQPALEITSVVLMGDDL